MNELKKEIEDLANIINNINEYSEFIELKSKVALIDIMSMEPDVDFKILPEDNKILVKKLLYKLLEKKEKHFNLNKSIKIHSNNILKKRIYSIDSIEKIYHNASVTDLYLGNIPKIFFEKTEFNNKFVAINLYEIFTKYSLEFNGLYKDESYSDVNDILNLKNLTDELSKELSILINRKITVEHINRGTYGNTFKIGIGKKFFCYKTFFPHSYKRGFELHGIHIEPHRALYTKANSPKNKFNKFYFGKIALKYDYDGFIITDYLENCYYEQTHKKPFFEYLGIDKIEENKAGNKIGHKIVDFGGIEEKLPELKNKKLRKFVRILCDNIYYKLDRQHLCVKWSIKKNQFNTLKKYFENKDFDTYLKAIEFIKKHKTHLPVKIYKTLKNIRTLDYNQEIIIEKALQNTNIIKPKFKNITRTLNTYEIKIKTKTDAKDTYNKVGFAIVDLFNNRNAVFFFDNNELIQKIRIEEQKDNEFITLFEITKDDIPNLKPRNLYELLQRQQEP